MCKFCKQIAFSILGFLLAMEACPQDFCKTIASVVAQGSNNFQDFRGVRDQFGDFNSNVSLPGATSCYVSGETFDFVCRWRAVPGDLEAAKSTLASGIQACYPHALAAVRNSIRGSSYSIRMNDITFRIHSSQRGTVFLGIGPNP